MIWRSRLCCAILFGLLVGLGCGHREAPQPPPQKIPAPIRDLSVVQRGEELLFTFTYPQTTISGLPVDDIIAIELWEYTVPVPELRIEGEEDDEGSEEGEDGDETDSAESTETDGGGEVDSGEDAGAEGSSAQVESGGDVATEADATAGAEAAGDDAPSAEDGAGIAPDAGREFDDLPDPEAAFLDPAIEGETETRGVRHVPEEDSADAAAAEGEGEEDSGEEVEIEGEEDGDEDEGGEEDGEDEEEPSRASPPKESLIELDGREFTAGAKLALTLADDELLAAIRGDRVHARLPLARIEPGEKEGKAYGVKSFQRLARASGFSNLVLIIPRVPPEPPADVEAEPGANGVRLSWSYDGPEPKGFRIYRRDPALPSFGDSIGTIGGDLDRFLDAGAVYGASYVYAVSTVIHQTPLVESELSAEIEVSYVDTFPPSPPTELVALPEVGVVRLLWDASDDEDVVGYIVLRSDGDGPFRPLFDEPRPGLDYADRTVSSGRRYTYQVLAVDAEGNRGEPEETGEVRVP